MSEIFNSLPYGIQKDGKLLKNFSLRKLTAGEFKLLNKRNFRENSPFTWLATALSYLLDEIDGLKIFDIYRIENFKKIPDIVKQLKMYDAFYVLYAGHFLNFDDKIRNFAFRCSSFRCGELNTKVEVPLKSLEFNAPNSSLVKDGNFKIHLEKGFDVEVKTDTYHITDINFTLPTLSTLIDNQDYSDDEIKFMELILKDCIKSFVWDNDTETDDSLTYLLKNKVFDLMAPYDIQLMNEQLVDIGLTVTAETYCTCVKCSSKNKYEVDLSFLLRM